MPTSQIKNMFNLMDENNDGKISFSEFKKVNDGVDLQKSPDAVEYYIKLFHQMDTNRNGVLSVSEIAAGLGEIGYKLTRG